MTSGRQAKSPREVIGESVNEGSSFTLATNAADRARAGAWCHISELYEQQKTLCHPGMRAQPKQAILEFVKATTDAASPTFVPPEARIATFDQDGTLWVEHPMYSQIVYCLDRVPAVVEKKPELKNVEPFKTVLSGDRAAMAKLTMPDLEKILAATLTGMTTDEFQAQAKKWIQTAKDARWKRPYTELTYQPMQEVLRYLRASGYQTYIVTGGGQDFVRVYADDVYGDPLEHIVGTAGVTKYDYGKDGKPLLMKEPKLLLNDNNAGKPEEGWLGCHQHEEGLEPHFRIRRIVPLFGDRILMPRARAA